MCPQASGTGEEAMVSVICSYDDLSRKLWNLKELPLTVTAVQGVHPALRYTDVSVLGHSPRVGVCEELGGGPGLREQRICHPSALVVPESPWGDAVPLLCCPGAGCAQVWQAGHAQELCWSGRFG